MWLTDPCRYDRWTRPTPTDSNGKTGGPTRVFTRVYVYFLGSVEAQQLVSFFRSLYNNNLITIFLLSLFFGSIIRYIYSVKYLISISEYLVFVYKNLSVRIS